MDYELGDIVAIHESFPHVGGYPYSIVEVRGDGSLVVTRWPDEVMAAAFAAPEHHERGQQYTIRPDERVVVVGRKPS